MGQPSYESIAIIGAGGAIGNAFLDQLARRNGTRRIHAFSRTGLANDQPCVTSYTIDYDDEPSIERAASLAFADGPLDLVLVTIGILHDGSLMPEKSLRDLSAENFQRIFMANTIAPALIAKHFLPKLHKERRAVFAALSARAGSITDNQLGGWYAYRASKAALNMLLKNAAIEINRNRKQTIIVGLDPGVVDSSLSKPFQRSIPEGKLFTPEFAVTKLLSVLDELQPVDSGKCYTWDGEELAP